MSYERKVNYVNKFGMKEQWGRNETADSAGGHHGATTLSNGNCEISLELDLAELVDGKSIPMNGIVLPAGAMVKKTTAHIIKVGVGAASIDVGIAGATLTDEDGFVGGCPVTDEGEYHEHMDEQATAIGILLPEMTAVTVKANGTFTAGQVHFIIEYRANADLGKRPLVTPKPDYKTVTVKRS